MATREQYYNPSPEDAQKIVHWFMTNPGTKREAAINSGVYAKTTAKRFWKDIWGSKNVQEALGKWRSEAIADTMENKAGEVFSEYYELAMDEGTGVRSKEKALRELMDRMGMSKKQIIEIQSDGPMSGNNPKELLEWLKEQPGIDVDMEEALSAMYAEKT